MAALAPNEFSREARMIGSPANLEPPLVRYALIAIALAFVLAFLRRWRREPPDKPEAAAALSPGDSARLESDLSRYEP